MALEALTIQRTDYIGFLMEVQGNLLKADGHIRR
jgi:hypothetical protein